MLQAADGHQHTILYGASGGCQGGGPLLPDARFLRTQRLTTPRDTCQLRQSSAGTISLRRKRAQQPRCEL